MLLARELLEVYISNLLKFENKECKILLVNTQLNVVCWNYFNVVLHAICAGFMVNYNI